MPPKGSKKVKPPLTIPGSPTYPGKKDGKGLEAPQWEACRRMLEGIYNYKEDNIHVAEIFMDLPDKVMFADYYETIPEPECLNNVANLLSDQAFATPDKFFAQLLLIFLNAKHYNDDSSQIFEDATHFEEQIWADWRKNATEGIFKGEPHLPKTQSRKSKKSLEPVKLEAPPPPMTKPSPVPEPPKAPKPTTITTPAVASGSRHSRSAQPAPVVLQTPNHPPPRGLTAADRDVVAATDLAMPRWGGPQAFIPGAMQISGIRGSGWWGDDQPEYESSQVGKSSVWSRIRGLLTSLTNYRDKGCVEDRDEADDRGRCPADTLHRVPAAINLPYLSYNGSISFAGIRSRSERGEYKTVADFDLDMTRLFERARRWYNEGTDEYGQILVLQRLFHLLTSPQSSPPDLSPSSTNFASIIAGPGRARPTHELDGPLSITTQKVPIKDRTFTTEARYKGVTYRVGDYVHLINPDDAAHPIIGQIYKTFIPTKAKKHCMTVCWYFRPEQSVHTADRLFLDREVMKTGHLCDHPVEDVIEKVSVQFFVKYVRGRSRAGEYYPGWPLYVCTSRYNDSKWLTIKIKNWASCIPEELRQSDFMSLVPFEKVIEPLLFPSPFLPGGSSSVTKWPGFIAEPRGQVNEDDDEDKVAPAAAAAVPSRAPPRAAPRVSAPSRPPAAPPALVPPPAAATQPVTATATQQQPPRPQGNPPPPPPTSIKTFGAMYGGQQAMDQIAYKEYLPIETSRLFERDSRQAVLWFSGPPLPATHESQSPIHSLEYLAYLAKRKRADQDDGGERAKAKA